MTTTNNAARVAVEAAACANQAESGHAEPAPLHLHEMHLRQFECGYHHHLTLSAIQVQTIAARMRGIAAITGLLMATDDGEGLELGEWMRGGLVTAAHSLAFDTSKDLELANENAHQGGAA